MAELTVTPSAPRTGEAIVVSGVGFAASTEVVVSIDALGLASEIVSDPSGSFGTDGADAKATALLTAASNPADGDTVTLGAVTYRFKDTMAQANDVKRAGAAADSLANLKKAVNLSGVMGTDYFAGTVIHPTVGAGLLTATTLRFYARTGGTGGNSLASTETSATALSFGGATFSGGAAGSGAKAVDFKPTGPGTFPVRATDGTNTATTTVRIWQGT